MFTAKVLVLGLNRGALGFPGGTSGKEPVCQYRRHETRVQSLGQEDHPLEEGLATTPAFLPGESHRQRNLTDYSPWGHKESDMTEQLNTAEHKHHNQT